MNDHSDQDPESEGVPDERILHKLVMYPFRLLEPGFRSACSEDQTESGEMNESIA